MSYITGRKQYSSICNIEEGDESSLKLKLQDGVSPMTYKKLKEMGYTSDDWQDWSDDEKVKKSQESKESAATQNKSEKPASSTEKPSKEEMVNFISSSKEAQDLFNHIFRNQGEHLSWDEMLEMTYRSMNKGGSSRKESNQTSVASGSKEHELRRQKLAKTRLSEIENEMQRAYEDFEPKRENASQEEYQAYSAKIDELATQRDAAKKLAQPLTADQKVMAERFPSIVSEHAGRDFNKNLSDVEKLESLIDEHNLTFDQKQALSELNKLRRWLDGRHITGSPDYHFDAKTNIKERYTAFKKLKEIEDVLRSALDDDM